MPENHRQGRSFPLGATLSPAHMARTSFTPVGNSADSPQPILRPSPVTGLDPHIFDVEKPYVGYDAETCPYQQPQRIMWTYFHSLNR